MCRLSVRRRRRDDLCSWAVASSFTRSVSWRIYSTPKHPSRTRARLTTLRSLNWPDNYDELLEDEKTAVQVAQDQANMDNMVTKLELYTG